MSFNEIKTIELRKSRNRRSTDTNVNELVIKEMSERKKRKNNTIMFRVPEPTTNVKLERINADLKLVKEIGAHIDVNIKDDDIVRVIRLGKKVDNNTSEGENTHTTRSRPLSITFSNENVKKNFVSKCFQIERYYR